MDSYVFCLAKKKALLRLHKEMNDLVSGCLEAPSGVDPSSWLVLWLVIIMLVLV